MATVTTNFFCNAYLTHENGTGSVLGLGIREFEAPAYPEEFTFCQFTLVDLDEGLEAHEDQHWTWRARMGTDVIERTDVTAPPGPRTAEALAPRAMLTQVWTLRVPAPGLLEIDLVLAGRVLASSPLNFRLAA